MSTGAISISSERQKSIDYTVTVMELVPGIATPRTNTGKGLSITDVDKVLWFVRISRNLFIRKKKMWTYFMDGQVGLLNMEYRN